MFWFSLGVFIGQNKELLLLSHLGKIYRFGDFKTEFQSLVYIFSGCWSGVYGDLPGPVHNVVTWSVLANTIRV